MYLEFLHIRINDPLVSIINSKTVYGTALFLGIGLSSMLKAPVLSPALFIYQTHLNITLFVCVFSFHLLPSDVGGRAV